MFYVGRILYLKNRSKTCLIYAKIIIILSYNFNELKIKKNKNFIKLNTEYKYSYLIWFQNIFI